jgi:hypothetical protein
MERVPFVTFTHLSFSLCFLPFLVWMYDYCLMYQYPQELPATLVEFNRSRFEHWDKNGDGRVSFEEFQLELQQMVLEHRTVLYFSTSFSDH